MLREPLRLRILRVILRPRRVILRRFLRLEPPVLGPKGFNELSMLNIPLGLFAAGAAGAGAPGAAGAGAAGAGAGAGAAGAAGAGAGADILALSYIIFVRTA